MMKTKYKKLLEERNERRARREAEILKITQRDKVSRAVAEKRYSSEVDAQATKGKAKILQELFAYAKQCNISFIKLSEMCGVDSREIYRWSHKEHYPKSRIIQDRINTIIKLGRCKKLEF